MAKMLDYNIVVSNSELYSLSDFPWERYETFYSSSYGLPQQFFYKDGFDIK